MNEAALGFLGLLNRGKKTVVGEAILPSMRSGDALIVASDASPDIAKKLIHHAERKQVILLSDITKERLGAALGFEKLSAVLIIDRKAAKALLAKWEGGKEK